MIIVLDTNVLVSGILNPYNKAAAILRLVADGSLQIAYDLRVLSEYRNVLRRPKFNLPKEEIDVFLLHIQKEGLRVSGKPLKFRLPDPDDECFLEIAVSAKVFAIVTGNKRHFPQKAVRGIKILFPAEFIDLLNT